MAGLIPTLTRRILAWLHSILQKIPSVVSWWTIVYWLFANCLLKDQNVANISGENWWSIWQKPDGVSGIVLESSERKKKNDGMRCGILFASSILCWKYAVFFTCRKRMLAHVNVNLPRRTIINLIPLKFFGVTKSTIIRERFKPIWHFDKNISLELTIMWIGCAHQSDWYCIVLLIFRTLAPTQTCRHKELSKPISPLTLDISPIGIHFEESWHLISNISGCIGSLVFVVCAMFTRCRQQKWIKSQTNQLHWNAMLAKKKFANPDSLKKHLTKVNCNKPAYGNACPLCRYTTKHRQNLYVHAKRKHTDRFADFKRLLKESRQADTVSSSLIPSTVPISGSNVNQVIFVFLSENISENIWEFELRNDFQISIVQALKPDMRNYSGSIESRQAGAAAMCGRIQSNVPTLDSNVNQVIFVFLSFTFKRIFENLSHETISRFQLFEPLNQKCEISRNSSRESVNYMDSFDMALSK